MPNAKSPEALLDLLAMAVRDHNYIAHAALYTADASPICKWDRETPDALFDAAIGQVTTMFRKHPREGLNRIYFSDMQGIIVATLVNKNTLLMMNAAAPSSLGMISLASSKVTQIIANAL
ncbi:MAG: hypothetical protein JXX14_14410 [Deltaproteobacteria bacterium]|nr:hypothetical protein [Deltaproteobacteria bacterium]